MTKWQILWYSINTLFILLLYVWMLFTIGNFPTIYNRISDVENKVNQIDYHINCESKKDTLIIINQTQQL